MIFIRNTPNNAGVAIYGDYNDFEGLYEALHDVVGYEGEYAHYEGARLRILGVCYDLRHALMGDRDYEFVENGMDEDKRRKMSVLAPDCNLYLVAHVLWPEILFVTMALNVFLEVYVLKQVKASGSGELFDDKKVIWDKNIAQVRMLQAQLAETLQNTVSKNAYARIHNLLNDYHIMLIEYITQYLDILNVRFLKMNKEKRLKNISISAKRIANPNEEYFFLMHQVRKEADRLNCCAEDLRINLEYPEDIDW